MLLGLTLGELAHVFVKVVTAVNGSLAYSRNLNFKHALHAIRYEVLLEI